jgi:hypothetical protein
MRITKALTVLALLNVAACHVYRGSAIEGWIYDAVTGKPVEGASVAVIWEIYGGVAHGTTIDHLLTEEVKTDSQGRFVLPPWGPKLVLLNELRNGTPTLVVGKAGYYFEVSGHVDPSSGAPAAQFTSEHRECACSGRKYSLKPFDGDWPQYVENSEIVRLNMHFGSTKRPLRCLWERTPSLTAEIVSRGTLFDRKGFRHSLPSRISLDSDPACDDLVNAQENN